MQIPKEIAEKVSEYQTLQQKSKKLWDEVVEWLNEWGADGVDIEDIYISEKPTGTKQYDDGEWCEQHPYGCCEDSFYGEYYHKIEGSDKYVGYHYSC